MTIRVEPCKPYLGGKISLEEEATVYLEFDVDSQAPGGPYWDGETYHVPVKIRHYKFSEEVEKDKELKKYYEDIAMKTKGVKLKRNFNFTRASQFALLCSQLQMGGWQNKDGKYVDVSELEEVILESDWIKKVIVPNSPR